MNATVEMCCGERPIEQMSHGRRERFCVRCGGKSDAGAATVRERMSDEMVEIVGAGPSGRREPALMMPDYELVRTMRWWLPK